MGAAAEELTIGSATEPSAIDPHFSRPGNNQQIAVQLFGRLVDQDQNLQIHPGLAESWANVDPTTWRITLRAGVRFRSEEDTSELQSLMRISYAVFCMTKKNKQLLINKTTKTNIE